MRDKDCGYALVGDAHLLDRTRQQVSCIFKRGSVPAQTVLQILALALQADAVASASYEPNNSNDDALSQAAGESEDPSGYGIVFWNFLERLQYAIFLISDLLAEHAMTSFVLSQSLILAAVCVVLCCCRSDAVARLRGKASEADQSACGFSELQTASPSVCINVTVEGTRVAVDSVSPQPAGTPKTSARPSHADASAGSAGHAATSSPAADDDDASDPDARSTTKSRAAVRAPLNDRKIK